MGQRSVKRETRQPQPPEDRGLWSRRAYLLDAAEGLRVLHLGCVDWPYLEQKLASGTLIHTEIARAGIADRGADSDEEGVEVFDRMGWACILGDVEDLPALDEDFDLVIAGEIMSTSPTRAFPHLAGASAAWHGRGDHHSQRLRGAPVLALPSGSRAGPSGSRGLLLAADAPGDLLPPALLHDRRAARIRDRPRRARGPLDPQGRRAARRGRRPWTADGIIVAAKTPAG